MSRRDAHAEAETRTCWQHRGRATLDQPSSQDATRTTVHDRRKPSRDGRKVQTAVCGADLRSRCSWRRAQEDQTRHGGNHDHAKKTVAQLWTKPNASHMEAWMRSTTRKASTHDSSPQCLAHTGMKPRLFTVMKSLFCAVEEYLSAPRTARGQAARRKSTHPQRKARRG